MSKNKLDLKILNSEIDNIDHSSGYNLIFVNDLMLDAELGVYAHEKNIHQPLRVNMIAKIKDIPDTSDEKIDNVCLLYTSPSPRDLSTSRMPSSA